MLRTLIPLLAIAAMAADAAAQQPIHPTGGVRAKPRSRPTLKQGTVKIVAGTGDVAVIQRYLRRGNARLRWCFERELNTGWAVNGTITIKVERTKTGVSTATVQASTLPTRPSLHSCLNRMMVRLRFPATASAVTFLVPLRIMAPPKIAVTPNLADPDLALAMARQAKERARAALKRSRCLARAGAKLARLAKRAKRSSAKRRLQLQPLIEKAQAAIGTCDQGSLLAGQLGSLGNPCTQVRQPCPGCRTQSKSQGGGLSLLNR